MCFDERVDSVLTFSALQYPTSNATLASILPFLSPLFMPSIPQMDLKVIHRCPLSRLIRLPRTIMAPDPWQPLKLHIRRQLSPISWNMLVAQHFIRVTVNGRVFHQSIERIGGVLAAELVESRRQPWRWRGLYGGKETN